MAHRRADSVRCPGARVRPAPQGAIEPDPPRSASRAPRTGDEIRTRTRHRRGLRPTPQDAAGQPEGSRDFCTLAELALWGHPDRARRGALGRRMLRARSRLRRRSIAVWLRCSDQPARRLLTKSARPSWRLRRNLSAVTIARTRATLSSTSLLTIR